MAALGPPGEGRRRSVRVIARSRSPDVVVVGAGVIGCAVARHLALRGARVRVLELGEPGA